MLFCHSFLPLFLSLDSRELLTFAQHLLLKVPAVAVALVAVALVAVALVAALAVVVATLAVVAAALAVVVDLADFAVDSVAVVESFSSGHIQDYTLHPHRLD